MLEKYNKEQKGGTAADNSTYDDVAASSQTIAKPVVKRRFKFGVLVDDDHCRIGTTWHFGKVGERCKRWVIVKRYKIARLCFIVWQELNAA